MALGLHQAEADRPLYIVAVQSAELEQWLSRVGIEAGDPVVKSTVASPISSVWVTGEWGQMIISPGVAVGMLVENPNGLTLPLDQLPVGITGKLVDYKRCDASRRFWDFTNIRIGSCLHVRKKIDRLDFYLFGGGKSLLIDDETAFHAWMNEGGRWLQLGAFPIGRTFRPQRFTGCRNAIPVFERIKSIAVPSVTIGKIAMRSAAGTELNGVVINTPTGRRLWLSSKEAQRIKVRLCDICWSCGICR